MKKLKQYTENLGVSRPIFLLKAAPTGSSPITNINIQYTSQYKYKPQPLPNDPLSELVCNSYSESFFIREGIFKIDRESIARQAFDNIQKFFVFFVEKNLPLRNPKQSKLYRWLYRNMPRNKETLQDGLILLYAYIKPFTDCDYKVSKEYKDHLDNTIALLDAMREKYGEK